VVAKTGVPLAGLPESAGGADAEWPDLFAVLRRAWRHSVPLPLAETMPAGWIATRVGLELSDGPMTVCPIWSADRLTVGRDGSCCLLSDRLELMPYASHVVRTTLIAGGRTGTWRWRWKAPAVPR